MELIATVKRAGQQLTIRLTLLFFSVAMMIAIAVTVSILSIMDRSEMKIYLDTARHTVNTQAMNINLEIQQVSSELNILANQDEFLELWDANGKLSFEVVGELNEEFLNVSQYRKLYDQVRFLDETGMEVIRINYNNGDPVVVTQKALQNKKGRYYFDDAIRLNRGQVFVSPFDLNIEHGEIELPLKPMLRFATPVVDLHGKKRGIVLLNFFGEKIIKRFSDQIDPLKGDQSMLVNADGYWLHGPIPDDTWGFMYNDGNERSFSNSYPEAWGIINSKESCQFELPQGVFTSVTVFPLLEGQKSSTGSGSALQPSTGYLDNKSYQWKIVFFTPSDILYASRSKNRIVAAEILSFLALIFLGVSLWSARVASHRKLAGIKLRESEAKYRSMMNAIKDSVYICSPDYHITYMNPAMIKRIGFDATGQYCFQAIHNLEKCCRWCEKKLVLNGVCSKQQIVSPRDNRYYEISHAPIHHEDGSISKITLYRDITDVKHSEQERERLIAELQEALSHVQTLSELLPICSSCKKIRDDKGYWNQIESFFSQHSDTKFSHGICPECAEKLYGNEDWYIEMENE